jgi:hypothetical protein
MCYALNPGLKTAFRGREETGGKPLAVAAPLKEYVLSPEPAQTITQKRSFQEEFTGALLIPASWPSERGVSRNRAPCAQRL